MPLLDFSREWNTMDVQTSTSGSINLLLRYGTSNDGKIVKKAHIYTLAEHGITAERVDPDAVWIVKRLRSAGYHAYIVGGAVRDLLVGRAPKDFDIATDALPQKIKRLFRSARLIGRRFRLVHVSINRDKYIEVTTFRSNKEPGTNNFFGTMEEDAQRRDFTINALYYSPAEQQLIDYVDGFTDIKKKRLKTLMPAEASFAEDPVRMIRAVKYASLTGFPIPGGTAALIRKMGESLLSCSRERVTEEVYKILISGSAALILESSFALKLFHVLFPALTAQDSWKRFSDSPLYKRAAALDAETKAGRALARDRMFLFLFRDLVAEKQELFEDPEPVPAITHFIRSASEPLFPSKRDLGVAVQEIGREYHERTGKHIHHRPQAQPHSGPRQPGSRRRHGPRRRGTRAPRPQPG
jgi:poly(A) polymerase